jgi:signal transduction histidine kinase
VRGSVRLGFGHLAAFVAVALVLNAQFTWWVIYSLGENRERLVLEQNLLRGRTRTAALQLEQSIRTAEALIDALPSGVIPAVAPPFSAVQVEDHPTAETEPLQPGWVARDHRTAYVRPLGRGRDVVAYLDPQAPYRWLAAIDPDLELIERSGQSGERAEGERPEVERPAEALKAPLGQLAVAADFQRWDHLLAQYRRRVGLVLAEGGLFVVAIITAVALLWRVLRRESTLEHQHQNFISAVTHELKTPIASIRVALETVLSGRVDAESRARFLRNALEDSERLGDLVEKVLEMTRYAGGAYQLRIAPGDLSQFVEEEVAVARRRAVARGTVLNADVQQAVQAPYDPEAMAIVLSNLVENAVKYAQGKPPRVNISLRIERGEAVIKVEDNGVGIAPSDLEAIFRPFYRASDEVTRRTPGTGIGLYVAREIVTRHGGRLTAASTGAGLGSTFRVSLPGAEALPDDELSEYISSNEAR